MSKNKIVGVFNFKGGVGKTFISSHILFSLNENYLNENTEYKICGFDTDTQADLMKWASRGKWDRQSPDFEVNERFKLIWLEHPMVKSGGYPLPTDGIIIIDGRPDLLILNEILPHLDILLIPMKGKLSLDSAFAVRDVINQVKEYKKRIKIFGIRNEILPLRVLASRQEKILFGVLEMNIFKYGITHSTLVRQAEEGYCPVWELPNYNPNSTVRFTIQQICEFILDKVEEWKIVYERV